jgi:hypothetical protein
MYKALTQILFRKARKSNKFYNKIVLVQLNQEVEIRWNLMIPVKPPIESLPTPD